jgi:hypothetical protein
MATQPKASLTASATSVVASGEQSGSYPHLERRLPMEPQDQHKVVIKKLLELVSHLESIMNGMAIIESLAKNPPSYPFTDRNLKRILKTIAEELPGWRFELVEPLDRYQAKLKCFIEEETDHGA